MQRRLAGEAAHGGRTPRAAVVALLGAALVAVLALLAMTTDRARSATPNPMTLTPVADTYAQSDSPSTTYGTRTTFRADGDPTLIAYLRFDVQGLEGPVQKAVLRIRAASDHKTGYDVSPVEDDSWGESSLNWGNRPAHGATAGSSGGFASGDWTEVDVTPLVTGDGPVSFAITTSSKTAMALMSRESGSGTAPKLVITTGSGGDDTTPPAAPTGLTATADGQDEIDLSWSAPPDADVVGYGVYRDGGSTPIASTTATSFSDTGLAPGSTHSYRVDAVDAAGNRSAKSSSASATTAPAGGGGGGATETYTPVADSYVDADRSGANFGTQTQLRADGSPLVRAFLRFNPQGLDGAVTKAVLRIHTRSSHSTGLRVHAVQDDGWAETGITHANAPAVGAVLGSTGAFSSGQVVEVDVTDHVEGPGPVSFAITTTSNTAMSLSSREAGAANAPKLVVTTGEGGGGGGDGGSLKLPLRVAFYYPWFPNAWAQNGTTHYSRYHPVLGDYDGGDPAVIANHIDQMQYGNFDAGIASWWGPGHHTDGRISKLLAGADGTGFKWGLYDEVEGNSNPSVSTIRGNLAYIRDKYATSPNFLRVDGRFVIFVYKGSGDGCDMARRWVEANTPDIGAYLVLHTFSGYESCAWQPDGWHIYGPAQPVRHVAGESFNISPGFYKLNESAPRLERDITRWRQNIRDMIASKAPWQIVTSFNEWGEGTGVENAVEWGGSEQYGEWLDALHENGAEP